MAQNLYFVDIIEGKHSDLYKLLYELYLIAFA